MTQADCDTLFAIKTLTRHGVSPTLAEIALFLGKTSRSFAHRRVQRLVELGFVQIDGRRARSIVLISPLKVEIERLFELYGIDAVRQAVMA